MANQGWIKLHRGLLDWEWYDDVNTKIVFLHLILKANHKEVKYRGETIKVGSLITGRELLSKETGLSVQQIRRAISNLETTREITTKKSRKGTVIQIVKYNDYQVATSKATTKQPQNNQKATTNKNEDNDKNEKNLDEFELFWDSYDKKTGRDKCLDKFLKLSDDHKQKIFETLPAYIESTPDKKFRKNPLTYLNGKYWNDELEDKQNINQALKPDPLVEYAKKQQELYGNS